MFGFFTVRAELQILGKDKPAKPKPATPLKKDRRENPVFALM